ncbi:MAG: amino acid adenylation domain-containing protein, partial [Cyanobacteria bacterium J06621_11]
TVSIQDDLANDILQTSGLDWSSLTIETTKAKFDLTLDIRETERGLIGRWEYRSDLFSADRIHRLAGHFRNLLRALPESSDLRISELPMLSRHELKQLKRWSMPTSTQPQPKETVHQLFETQAQLNPTATAITYHQTQLSYQDLNEKANQLAYVLQRQEIAAETPVGIWAVRSPATIIAILATLKAGGTYVPLDPQYPVERLKWMISDTRMALLVGEFSENPVPQEIESVIPSIDLMATAEDIAAQPTVNPNSLSTTAESLAYVLYTSGSTGQPKGVCVTHQGITRLVKDPNYVTLTSDDILLQAAPLTFDASTFEVWGALLNGGKLVLLPEQMPSLTTLGQAIATHQVTTLWLTSGLFNLMVDEQLESLSSVRQLLAGGDVLSATHLRKALSVLKHTQIINGYGPTEGTTFTCCHSVTAQDLTSAIPIGYPISQTQVYVLDADLQQVPIGIPGELYIGGAGVARGYLQRPALTAEKFVPNPYFEVRGANAVHSLCLYKSGDRVRYRADGALEYLGRIDHQVKVRGFRLELGEIESAIEAYPAVQQSIVVVFGESAEEKRLVAYIEAATEKTTTEQTTTEQTEISRTETNTIKTHELRAFLLEKLPDYMIPVKFVWVETLPLTANGKVDKQSLPEPQWNIVNQSSGKLLQKYELPTTEIETTLIKIFSSLLPAESIGIHDNFFELGGDSILAMQIVSRAAQLGLSLSPKQLFQYQTVSELAKIVKRDVQRDNQIAAQPPISPAPATGEVPLTPIQRWFFEQDLANPHHFNQSVCLELPNDLNRKALAQAIAQLYTHHDALRLRFKQVDTQWRQAFSADITPPSIQWFDYSQLTLEDQNNAIAQQIPILQSSLNLEKGPLLSIGGFELGSARASQLFIAIHHLVVDGVSWRILLADLQQAYQQAYQQAINQESIRLFPKTHSYQQWANELSRRSRSSDIKADADYWSAIAQAQPFIIPQQDANQSFRNNSIDSSQTIFTTLPEQSTQALLQEVPAIYNTQILDVLLTAFTQSLTMWASCESVTIDLESYGRFSPELNLSRTVGWFTALYPVALSFRSENTLSDNLKSIQSQIKAVPHEGISYGLLCYMNNCDAVDNNLEVSEKLLQVAPPISFNYLGQLTTTSAAGFKRIELPESCRNTHQSLNNHRAHLIDVNSWIEAGELKVVWTFSHRLHTEAVIEKLATQFIQNLSALIDYCCTQENVEYAPEDFGLAQLDSSALASVLSQVSFATADSAAESAADLSPSVDSQKQDAQEQDAQEQEVSR